MSCVGGMVETRKLRMLRLIEKQSRRGDRVIPGDWLNIFEGAPFAEGHGFDSRKHNFVNNG